LPRMAGLKGEAGESPALSRNGNQEQLASWKPGRPPLLTRTFSRRRGWSAMSKTSPFVIPSGKDQSSTRLAQAAGFLFGADWLA